MPRKIIMEIHGGATSILTEALADDEAQLQELVKDNPDLIPIEEFGFEDNLMVVGREARLPSGAVDLVGVTRNGNILVMEFKTGPQNSDFRHALAQLLDYGSDLWELDYEEFEISVAKRYFESDRCEDWRVKGKSTMLEAAAEWWSDLSEEETETFRENVERNLKRGTFEYVLVAQRITESIQKTMEYLNASMSGSRFYALEIVRFVADSLSAFETRTILKPGTKSTPPEVKATEEKFLQNLEDDHYRSALQQLFDVCRGLGLRFNWGLAGTSIRLRLPDNEKSISIAWVYPPGINGYRGTKDFTLGIDRMPALKGSNDYPALERFVERASSFRGAEKVSQINMSAYVIKPPMVVELQDQIAEAISDLANQITRQG